MVFRDEISALAARAPSVLPRLASEEAGKQSLVLPLLEALGYDAVGLSDVAPEYPLGGGVGRVDYAVLDARVPVLLVECKALGQINGVAVEQLRRYFNAAEVRFGVLTNGLVWSFYTDAAVPGVMDASPFFIFDLEDYGDGCLEGLRLFAKGFSLAETLEGAADLPIGRAEGLLAWNDGGSPESRDVIEECGLAVVKAAVAVVADVGAVRMERHRDSTNFYYWPRLRGSRRRLCRLDFDRQGLVLRVYGSGGNYDEVKKARLGSVGAISWFAADIALVAGEVEDV